ncbi:MAG: FtsX-like permease family protein [Phycisphaerae bacterium]
MRHWSQLATRNWRAKWFRTLGAVLAIALGTASVIWVTSCYESIRQTVLAWAGGYVGKAHIMVTSPLGKYDQIPERLVDSIREIPNVKAAVATLVQRLRATGVKRGDLPTFQRPPSGDQFPEVDFIGVLMPDETELRDHAAALRGGRMLTPDDRLACVLDSAHAGDIGVGVGDALLVYTDVLAAPVELEIVGLIERKRLTSFQKALAMMPLRTLQEIRSKQVLVTSIDVQLTDGERETVQRAAAQIRSKVRSVSQKASIRSVEMRMKQIEAAQSQQSFVLVLLSCVAMLTALFIILSTLSMGMVERIVQLGLMRCIGLTRMQLATLVLVEVLPMGAVGIGLGVPIGLALTMLTVWLVPDYVGGFAISWNGVAIASAAGMATTLIAGLLPAMTALRVSPMEAARPRAAKSSAAWLVVVAALSALTLVVQHFVVLDQVSRSPSFVEYASAGIVMLYIGYALLAPLAVKVVGTVATHLVAAALNVRTRLLADQVGHAVWRSAGLCCGLMVGLSLIVGIFVVNESVTRGWQFPKQFPGSYIWSTSQMTPKAKEIIAAVPHIKSFSVANATNVFVEEKPMFMADVVASVTWFMGIDPDSFLTIVKFEFLEGDPDEAMRLMREGGHVLIADDFARSRNKHLGDTVRIIHADRVRQFKIAGVIVSPAIDIAAGFFQALTEYNVGASGSVIGTNDDLKKHFGIDGSRVVMLNLDLPPEPVPSSWPPPRGQGERLEDIYYDTKIALDRRWQRYREDQTLRDIQKRLDATGSFRGSISELKDEIDRELSKITRLMTAVPLVALIVAALGVANLMTANVVARAKQIAILRAVGATRSLVLRLVIGEAIVLGVLGSAMGLLLGIHLAANITEMVQRMWGYRVVLEMPWMYLAAAACLTIGLCIIAGVMPARHAARNNIVDALHVS